MAEDAAPVYMDVSKNRGTPKSSILIGVSIINHPFWGTTIFGNTHMKNMKMSHFFIGYPISSAGFIHNKSYKLSNSTVSLKMLPLPVMEVKVS